MVTNIKRRLLSALRVQHLNEDRWRLRRGLLSSDERRALRWRSWMLVSLKGVYETIRLPITVGRAIVAVVAMAREWEALHFRERRKVKMGFGSVIDRQTWLLC